MDLSISSIDSAFPVIACTKQLELSSSQKNCWSLVVFLALQDKKTREHVPYLTNQVVMILPKPPNPLVSR